MRTLLTATFVALAMSCSKEPAMIDKAPTSPTTQTTGVHLAARANGAMLEVAWTNTTQAALKIATHVFAGEKHFDWLTVNLTDAGGGVRKLQFLDDRDEAGAVVVDVAPGASVTESVDLARWAARAANGSKPLAAGTYRAQVIYDSHGQTRGWVGRIDAATTVTIP
jgi:hypothetical protein